MQISLKLHYPYDADLIALRNYLGKRFQYTLRQCLASCIAGIEFTITIPDNIIAFLRIPENIIVVNLHVQERRDRELIHYLSSLPNGSRNHIMKLLIRSCYSTFPVHIFTGVCCSEKKSLSKMPKKTNDTTPKTVPQKSVPSTTVVLLPQNTPSIQQKSPPEGHESIHTSEESFDAMSQINMKNLFGNMGIPDFSHLKLQE